MISLKKINIENLIYLTLLGMPLYLVRFNLFGIPTNILDILMGITILFWIVKNRKKKCFFSIFNNLDLKLLVPVLIIVFGVLISILANQNYTQGFGILKSWFLLPIAFAIITGIEIRKTNDYSTLIKILFSSSFLVSIISIFYLFSGRLTYDERLSAFYLSPNHLAMFLAPGFLIGIILLTLDKKEEQRKSILYIALLLISLSLYFTYSYATWVAIFLGYLSAIFITEKDFLRFIENNKKIFLLVALVLFLVIFLQKNNQKFLDILSFEDRSSLSSRIMIWESSIKILGDNWLAGIGPGNFQEKYLEYQKYFPPYLEWAVPQPHNLYLAFWLQGGILGIFGFIWLIYGWIKNIFHTSKKTLDESQKKLALILLAIMIYTLIHGTVDTPYWKNDLSLIFWILIFLLY